MGIESGETITGLQGAYRIETRHGEGSFGVTYRARDVSNETLVIVKELRIEKLDDWKALELFEREGRVLASLSHPNIPAFHDFFARGATTALPVSAMSTYDGPEHLSLVLVQEFIEGVTLEERVDHEEPLALDEAEGILESLLQTLAYLHAHSPALVHRDIKPGNIIVAPNGTPHLVDFGAIQERIRNTGTSGSTIVGTLGYMPLEQVRGDARPASDLYALGMTMVVALAGQPLEKLTFDDATGKVDLDAALPHAARYGLREVLGAMTEPLLGARAHSAKEMLAGLARKEPKRETKPRAKPVQSATSDEARYAEWVAPKGTDKEVVADRADEPPLDPDPGAQEAKLSRQARGVAVLSVLGLLLAISVVFAAARHSHAVVLAAAASASAARQAAAPPVPTTVPIPRPDDALDVPPGNKSMKKLADDCRAGLAEQCTRLGSAHYHLSPPDHRRAADAYRRACDGSSAEGCDWLATAYLDGDAVDKDRPRGRVLQKKACDLGKAQSCAYYGYGLMNGDGVTTDLAAGMTYCERACRAGAGVGCNNLALFYRDGKGVKADPERAAGLFAQACDGTYKNACVPLGNLYAQGLGVTRDRPRAVSLYTTACTAKVQAGCDALTKLNLGPPK